MQQSDTHELLDSFLALLITIERTGVGRNILVLTVFD
jgi:hypothetical protein